MTEKKLNQILENQERIEKRIENIEMLLVNLATSFGEVEEYVDVSFKYDLIQEKYADNHLFQKFLRDLEEEMDEDLPF